MTNALPTNQERTSLLSVFAIFLRLGCFSFGGPVAHLGYFQHEFVEKRKWLSAAAFADLVALCQFLPGPASSQLAIAVGQTRAGSSAGMLAWLGFVLPSAALMYAFALGIGAFPERDLAEAVHALKLAACAIVAQALYLMLRRLCSSIRSVCIALSCALITLALPSLTGQLLALVLGALLSCLLALPTSTLHSSSLGHTLSRRGAARLLGLWLTLLLTLPLLCLVWPLHALQLFDSFYRTGSLVFGGAHVVLPLLQAEVVNQGWLSNDRFLAGYGFVQAMPGPLFSFALFIGAASPIQPNGLTGGILALIAIYLPSALLVLGILPYWQQLGQQQTVRRAMPGVLAAVVGLLLAALITPVASSALFSVRDWCLFIVLVGLLQWAKAASWLMVAVALGTALV
jgi:chromate transporter